MVGSMLNIVQWTQIPAGASGSSRISARLFASSGVPVIVSGGFIFSPSHVYLAGIFSLLLNAVLEIFILIEVIGALAGPLFRLHK